MIPWETFKNAQDAYDYTQNRLRDNWPKFRPLETAWGGPDNTPCFDYSAPRLPDRFETFWADPDGCEAVTLPVRR